MRPFNRHSFIHSLSALIFALILTVFVILLLSPSLRHRLTEHFPAAGAVSPLPLSALIGQDPVQKENTPVFQPPAADISTPPLGLISPAEETGDAPLSAAFPAAFSMDPPEAEPYALSPIETAEKYEVSDGALKMTNHTSYTDLSLAGLRSRALTLTLAEDGPQILIMHTHATEAYTIADGDDYTPTDPCRTTDCNYNVVRVGEEIKTVFEEMGFSVVHDKTLYDYPGYNGSYSRAMKGIAAYLEKYPSISVVLDVHRDALIDADGTSYKVSDQWEGEDIAQVMLVVGTDDSGLEHPGWRDNLTLAVHIQEQMLTLHPTFPRAIDLRAQRFNQHLTPGSLLVEVGSSGNTLQEALAGARLFARAAGTALSNRYQH